MSVELQTFTTSGGARIYRIPLHLFPSLYGYVHLVMAEDLVALVDVGSGFGDSNEQLEAGIEAVRREHDEQVDWSTITHLLITHGHIDHFGGLRYVRERTTAKLGIHELDRRVLTRYEERVAITAKRLSEYLAESGVGQEEQVDLMDLYLLNKQLFQSQEVDFTFGAMGMRLGPLEMIHVPGHTPGHVVLILDEVLLVGDHILQRISPHLAPERLTLHTGLRHYLDSLETLRPIAEKIELVLGGHEEPFTDLERRIDEVRGLYIERLHQTLEISHEPKTIAELAAELFGTTAGYHRILGLEEAGAYVEYLQQLGHLGIEDPDQYENESAIAVRYRAVDPLGYPLHAGDRIPARGKGRRAE